MTLVSAGLFAAVMFLDAHDALLVCLVSAFSGIVAVLALRVSMRGVLTDIDALREHLVAVGQGRRGEPLAVGGRDELTELADAANRMEAQLASAEDTRRALVAAVSHDLRTPITSLRLIGDALGDGVLAPDERQRYLDGMRAHITALSRLIDDLFELSCLEAGQIAWSVQHIEIGMLVGETVEAMRAEADENGVVVRCNIPAGLPAARANPEKLQRVLFNLIQNAIRHTPRDGSVTVLAQADDDTVEIEVRDTGEGVDSSDRRYLDAFFQGGGRAARTGGGAGLGLAISRAIVEAHGGSRVARRGRPRRACVLQPAARGPLNKRQRARTLARSDPGRLMLRIGRRAPAGSAAPGANRSEGMRMAQELTLDLVDRDGAIGEALDDGLSGSRRDLFKKLAAGGTVAAAGGLVIGGLPSIALGAPSAKQDVKILNFALLLEYLESSFYVEAVKKGNFPGQTGHFARVVRDHELAHVAYLKKALGSKAIKKPSFDFRDTTSDLKKFQATAKALEDTGVSAYNGQGTRLTKATLAAAATIVSVEARHAAWIRYIVSHPDYGSASNYPAPAAFDKARTMKQVKKIVNATGFVQ